jgi:hypothetical protein
MLRFSKLKKPNATEMKALFILSIVLPVGLLASFRLTGVLKKPPETQKIILETQTLILSRPHETMTIANKSVQNTWINGRSSVVLFVEVRSYREGSSIPPYYGRDGVRFKTSVDAGLLNSRPITTVKISFHVSDENSTVFVSEERWNLHLNNATLTGFQYLGTISSDAYISAQASNLTFAITDEIYWVFLDEHDEAHELQVTAEITHPGEASMEKVTVPIALRMILS